MRAWTIVLVGWLAGCASETAEPICYRERPTCDPERGGPGGALVCVTADGDPQAAETDPESTYPIKAACVEEEPACNEPGSTPVCWR